MPVITAGSTIIDPTVALAEAHHALERGEPTLALLRQVTLLAEILAGQVDTLADQLTEARTCPVTNLPTRAAWTALAEEVCAAGPARVILIDLDDFKPVNDQYGHAAGDAVLAAVGRHLLRWTDGRGYAGRLGGDEFVLAVHDAPELDQHIADLGGRLSGPVSHDSKQITVGASLGVARVPGRDGEALSGALGEADRLMYQAKGHGRR